MKKVLFISCYADNDFREVISSGLIMSQAAQKFDKLIVKGFLLNAFDVDVALIVDSNRQFSSKETFLGSTINYHYCFSKGGFIKKYLSKKAFSKKTIDEWVIDEDKRLIVADSLRPGALEFIRYSKKRKIPVALIVTDFPDLLFDKKASLIQKIKNHILKKNFYKQFKYATTIVILTDYMKQRIVHNCKASKNATFLLMEGLCDTEEFEQDDKCDNVVLYSGILSKQFGLENLINAFIDANLIGYELHLYGSGDYVNALTEICKKHSCVKFFGVVPNEIIIKKQRKAKFLVNPRPVGDEYTLYSFPSKTIEYMKSGRPVITTKLPGIPRDYYNYLLFFDGDGRDDMCKSLIHFSKMDDVQLAKLGDGAKSFVENQKNNKVQVSKIINCMFGENELI